MFSALNYFTEQDVLFIFERVFFALSKDKGREAKFYVGEIPNKAKLWDFANTVEYEKMYFDSLKAGKSAIGTWFIPEDLVKMAKYVGFSKANVIELPDWHINSHFRFDLLLMV